MVRGEKQVAEVRGGGDERRSGGGGSRQCCTRHLRSRGSVVGKQAVSYRKTAVQTA